MDFTSRMVVLLGELRRERNGAVADAMRLHGTPYGLNYGVSLPTLRQIARAEHPDHDFARYLLRQEVRELRLAAFHIAQPERLTLAQSEEWGGCIVNSEIAEEAAFALLSRAAVLPELFRAWTSGADPLLQYAALLAAARSPLATADWAYAAVEVVRRNAAAEKRGESSPAASDVKIPLPTAPAEPAVRPVAPYAALLTAQGAVALLAALGSRNEENRQAVLRAAGSLGKLPAEDFVHEELAWRLEA